jgi:hypothetical protein
MKHVTKLLFCLGLLALSVAGARAQSMYGPGGLFLYPTADVPPQGQLTLGVLVLPQRIPPTPGLHTNPTWGSTSIDYGLTPDLEIGATSLAITDFRPSYGGYFKYRFLRGTGRRPSMAIGATYSRSGDNSGRAAFLALRQPLNADERRPIIGHLGVTYINVLAGLPYNQYQPYGGIEWGLGKQFTLIAEARPRGKSDFKTSSALSLAYRYGRGGLLVVSLANTGQSTQSRFGFGVGYQIGVRR